MFRLRVSVCVCIFRIFSYSTPPSNHNAHFHWSLNWSHDPVRHICSFQQLYSTGFSKLVTVMLESQCGNERILTQFAFPFSLNSEASGQKESRQVFVSNDGRMEPYISHRRRLRLHFFIQDRLELDGRSLPRYPANGPLYGIADTMRMSSMGPPLFADTAEGEGNKGGAVVVQAAARNRVGSQSQVGTDRVAPTEVPQFISSFSWSFQITFKGSTLHHRTVI